MSNNVSFVGRLGRDSEIKDVNGNTILEFTVASDVGFGDKKTTNWFRCALWGKRGERIQQYLKKGKQVFVTGELIIRKYTGKEGAEKTSADVRVSDVSFFNSNESNEQAPQQQAPTQQQSTEEEMPF